MAAPGEHDDIVQCTECGSALAHDQRYCIECGARRGLLPFYISQIIDGIREQGRRLIPPAPLLGEHRADGPAGLNAWLAAPRAAAVAVIGMLGFGAVVGSLAGGAGASDRQPLLVAFSPSATQPSASAGGGTGRDSAAGATGTITVGSTSPANTPASAAPSTAGPGASSTTGAKPTPSTNSKLPPIKHVFLIALSGQGYNQTFAHSNLDPYLAKTLASRGELIGNYYSVAGGPLANEIALISGQGPTPQTLTNCPVFQDVAPGGAGAAGQVLGSGCAYPKSAPTIADQLTNAHLKWTSYLQTTGTTAQAQAALCRPKLGSASQSSPQPVVSWRNPFLYFHSITDKSACPTQNVDLGRLANDLKSERTTPALSYIVPDLCDDGADTPCSANAQSGTLAADAFLKSVVPEIEKSAAYRSSGMIVITFDQAPQTGPNADPSSCCNNPTYPNLASTAGSAPTGATGATGSMTPTTSTGATGATGPQGPADASPSLGGSLTNPTGGGGKVGLLLLTRYVKPGTMDVFDYFNHFSLLASIEDLFGLKRLGYASETGLPVFGAAVYTAYSG